MCTPTGWYAGPSLLSFQVAIYTYTWVRRSTQLVHNTVMQITSNMKLFLIVNSENTLHCVMDL